MQISQEAIREFQDAYYKDFGERVTEKEAEMLGSSLIALMGAVYRPIHNNSQNH